MTRADSGGAKPPHPDAELIALWELWHELRQDERASWDKEDCSRQSPAIETVHAMTRVRSWDLRERIIATKPKSIVGVVVQLRVLSTVLEQSANPAEGDLTERWFSAILDAAEPLAADVLPPWDRRADSSAPSGPDGDGAA